MLLRHALMGSAVELLPRQNLLVAVLAMRDSIEVVLRSGL